MIACWLRYANGVGGLVVSQTLRTRVLLTCMSPKPPKVTSTLHGDTEDFAISWACLEPRMDYLPSSVEEAAKEGKRRSSLSLIRG